MSKVIFFRVCTKPGRVNQNYMVSVARALTLLLGIQTRSMLMGRINGLNTMDAKKRFEKVQRSILLDTTCKRCKKTVQDEWRP